MMNPAEALHPITPEATGVPSGAVQKFLKRLADKQVSLHSVLMIRHGRMFAEGYYAPFTKDSMHRMYSISKSFVSAAIGCMIGEGKLSLTDHVVDLFPEYTAGKELHPYMRQATIRDLLMMADPHATGTYDSDTLDWIGSYFDTPPSHLPGQIFHYNTAATVVLCALVEKLSGMPYLEYLRKPLLDPIGFSKDTYCIKTCCGRSWGGSGVICTSRDLARFALVFLNGGRWGDQQLIPADYAKAATSKQISTVSTEQDVEMCQGYGYKFWRTRHNGFACRGMGSQLAICLPDQDFLLVTTADTQALSPNDTLIYDALWEEILPYLNSGKENLPEDPAAQAALQKDLDSLSLLTVPGSYASPVAEKVSGKVYAINQADGEGQISKVSFRFTQEGGSMEYTNKTGNHKLTFGYGHQVEQAFPELHYFGKQIGIPSGKGYRTFGSGAWQDDNTLFLRFFLADEYFGTLKMTIRFEEDSITFLNTKTAEWFLNDYLAYASGHAE